jgi:antitoxin component YwqK of YwqJK toxin-antitoxin module
MIQVFRSQISCFAVATTILVAACFVSPAAAAATDQPANTAPATSNEDSKPDEGIEIKPYTGAPIFLDEPATPPESSLVGRSAQNDKYPDGKIRIERQIAKYSDNHFVADGFYHEYYASGQKFVDGQYKSGRPDGQWTYFYDNGTQNRQVTFKDGQPDGTWDVHRADGSLMATRSFKLGKRDGTWTIYDDTGKQPLRVESYADGKADGEWKLWFPSGQLQRQIGFKQGERHGLANEWDEKGKPRIEMIYVDGKLDGTATSWTSDGRKIVQQFKDGKPVAETSSQ